MECCQFWDFFVCLSRASTFAEKEVFTWSTTLLAGAAYRTQIFVARVTRDLFALADFLVFVWFFHIAAVQRHVTVASVRDLT